MARKLAFDRILFSALIALAILGCIMVYSASALEGARTGASPFRYLIKQSAALLAGATLAAVLSRVDWRRLRDPHVVYGVFGACLVLCAGVLLRPPINAARRWYALGSATFQPSELLKVALVLALAYQLDRKRDRLDDPVHGLLPLCLFVAVSAGLVLAEPDFGTAATYLAVAAALLWLAGTPGKYFLAGGLACVPLAALAVLSAPYRRERLLAYLHPQADPLGRGFQAAQSLIAVGAGGLAGNGLGQSRQKLFFLPYPHTDFIFAIVSEELGFLGAAAVILLFGVVAWRGLRAARRAPEPFLSYLAAGTTCVIVLQAAINLGVVLTLLPTKGIPLPFISYGGSSLVADCLAAGLLLNVSQHSA